jgi:gliding motility-associated-like protein
MLLNRFITIKLGLPVLFILIAVCVNAQDKYIVKNPIQYSSGEAAEAADEVNASRLDSFHIMDAVQKTTGASTADMKLFSAYYADTLINDNTVFMYKAHTIGITDAELKQYATEKEQKYTALYNILKKIILEFPSTVAEYTTPHPNVMPTATCTPACTNIDFSAGNLNGWNAYYATNSSTVAAASYTGLTGGACGAVTKAALDPAINGYKANSTYQVILTKGAGNDPIAGAAIPIVAPGATYSCRVGDSSEGGSRVAILQQSFEVTTSNENFTYQYAFLVDSALHNGWERPYFSVTITDQTTGVTLPCGVYVVAIDTLRAGFSRTTYRIPAYGWTDPIFYKPWTSVFVSLQNYVGDCVSVQVQVSDCFPSPSIGPHFCYAYFDASCAPKAVVSIASDGSPCKNDTLTAPVGGTYVWAGPCIVGSTTNQSAIVSCAGTYTVTITSPDGCSDTLQKVVTFPPPITATTTPVNLVCNGATDGSASVTGSGGTAPYTYKWTPSAQTNSTATGLSAGTYTAVITDTYGCTATATVALTQPPPIATTTSSTPSFCNLSNGSATVNPSGGAAPYTYNWTTAPVQTTATASNISAGTYNVTITDNNGCTKTTTVTVTQPSAVTAKMGTPTNVTCNGDDNGSATVTATGGTVPYTYAWAATGGNAATAANLSAGGYTVTVTDNNGCVSSATVTITQPTALGNTTSNTPASCGLDNGSASITVTGGTVPYTYGWSTAPPQTTATASNIGIGSYTVIVADNNGCTTSAIVTVTEPPTISCTTSFTPASCNLPNGSATVTPSGGVLPYTYAWNTVPPQTGATAINIGVGTYTVLVTGNNGCTGTATVTVTQPPTVTISISSTTGVSCHGGDNGTGTATANGGAAPYTYGWATTPPQLGPTATGLSAGTYSVGVEDNNGCESTTTVVITQPTLLVATICGNTPVTCNGGDNGASTCCASGGTAPYNYAWTPSGGNAAAAPNLSAGTYTVTVTDANGCTATTSVIITQPALLITSAGQPNNVPCNGGDNGSATAISAGGTAPYTYVWSPIGGNKAIGSGFTAGTYTVTTTDAHGCTATAAIAVTQPPVLAGTTTFTPASCNLHNGSATVTATGGTAPYTYLWNTTPPQTTATADGVSAGTYTVGIIDNNGCTTSTTVTVTQPSAVTASICGSTGVSCNGGDNGTANCCAVGGNAPYIYSWTPVGGNAATGTGFSAGEYTVTVTDASGCVSTASVVIAQPAKLTVTISGPKIVCVGSIADITATVAGGTAPYTYVWPGLASTGNTAAIIGAATAETYTVDVTDANGCTTTAIITIQPPPAISVSITGQTSMCPGMSATLCANASGGTGGDTYLWEPGGQTTPCITVTPAATTIYTVTVTDNCGVGTNANGTIRVNPYPDVNFIPDLYQGCIPLCIVFHSTTTVAGGSAESYEWNFGNGDSSNLESPIYCYPASGVYDVTLTVVSDSGCSATLKKPKLITVFPNPVAAFAVSPQPTTILNPTIQFTNESTDSYPIIYWFWNFGDGTVDSLSNTIQDPTHTYLDTGSYCPTLVVMDEHGCVDTATNCLMIDPIFTLYIPSAFTPNGDGMDDTFLAKGVYVKTFEMDIFDRWGEHLFHSNSLYEGWPGTVNGGSTISQEDVYVYKIIATDWENNAHNYIGKVTLLR